jgi:tRNA-specific 2-thiouridylase
MPRSALVCLSGGVDSAVAACLLREDGYDVSAVTFWFWSFLGDPVSTPTKCCSLDAASQAARELDIPHEFIDATDAFRSAVLDDFVAGYREGDTPNPCGWCNRSLRFRLALDLAARRGIDYVATGHHVRIERFADGTSGLLRGSDPSKDQTYFLYGLDQTMLARLLFPVGELTKRQVFELARKHGLSASALPESQDLCFAPHGDFSFLFDAADLAPGPILDLEGQILGRHNGLPRYTVGQRRGLGIAASKPLFVVSIDVKRNALIVGEEADLYSAGLRAGAANYLSGTAPREGERLEVKIRYRSPASSATFHPEDGHRFLLRFDEPQRAVTPGQIVALYAGERLLGGGIIGATWREPTADEAV